MQADTRHRVNESFSRREIFYSKRLGLSRFHLFCLVLSISMSLVNRLNHSLGWLCQSIIIYIKQVTFLVSRCTQTQTWGCVSLEASFWVSEGEVCYSQVTILCSNNSSMKVHVCYLLVTNCMSNILDISLGIKGLTRCQKPEMSLVHVQEPTQERAHQIRWSEHCFLQFLWCIYVFNSFGFKEFIFGLFSFVMFSLHVNTKRARDENCQFSKSMSAG